MFSENCTTVGRDLEMADYKGNYILINYKYIIQIIVIIIGADDQAHI